MPVCPEMMQILQPSQKQTTASCVCKSLPLVKMAVSFQGRRPVKTFLSPLPKRSSIQMDPQGDAMPPRTTQPSSVSLLMVLLPTSFHKAAENGRPTRVLLVSLGNLGSMKGEMSFHRDLDQPHRRQIKPNRPPALGARELHRPARGQFQRLLELKRTCRGRVLDVFSHFLCGLARKKGSRFCLFTAKKAFRPKEFLGPGTWEVRRWAFAGSLHVLFFSLGCPFADLLLQATNF